MQVIHFIFAGNGTPYVGPTRDDLHEHIINRNNNQKVRINSISPFDTYLSLGTVQGIAPKQREQFRQLQQKAKDHTKALLGSQVSTKRHSYITFCVSSLPLYTLQRLVILMNIN